MINFVIDILVWWMILDAVLSYFHFNMHQPMYKVREFVSRIQILYLPIRKIIKPRGVDLSPLVLILGLQFLGRFLSSMGL